MKTLEIVCVCVAAILAGLTASKWKEINTLVKVTLIFVIITAIMVAINAYKQHKRDELIAKIEAKIGEIKDPHGAYVPKLRIGNSYTYFQFSDIGGFKVDNEPLLKLYVKDGKLFVYAIIRESANKVIGVINENVWTVFDGDYEYNNDDTGFEMVTQGVRKVYFQVYLKDGYASISGILINKYGNGLALAQASKELSPRDKSQSYIIPIPDVDISPVFENTKRLFQYPRGKFIGQREN
ncbi:MAG: hypothetical protein JWR72_2074 [Flavisolibacter sp.]|nr:hypothetical protein [Flavisolibacter sp.]